MIRKTYSALALLAVAGMVMVGCGKEDLTELDTTWGTKEGDVVTKLADFQTKNQDFAKRLETIKVDNAADTAKAADRAMVETMVKDQAAAVGEIEQTLNELKTKREEALKAGVKADYEAAWKDAEPKYEAALTRLNELEKQQSDIDSKLNGLNTTTPAVTDTTVANGTVKSDTTAMNAGGSTSTTTTANGTSTTANGTGATAKKAEVKTTTTTAPTTTKAENNDKKPLIEKNKNP